MAELRYYLIRDRLVGKEECGAYYLFREGAWLLQYQMESMLDIYKRLL